MIFIWIPICKKMPPIRMKANGGIFLLAFHRTGDYAVDDVFLAD